MIETPLWESFRVSRHEQTRIAYLFLSLLKNWIHPEMHVTFVGPGDYTEVAAWNLAVEVVNGGLTDKPVINVVELPERSWGVPRTVSRILSADYCLEMRRVTDFFEETQTGLVIARNPPYLFDPSAQKDALMAMMSWAKKKGAAMLLTLRRGETDSEFEQALSGYARRLETPMTADHLGDDEVIFLCE